MRLWIGTKKPWWSLAITMKTSTKICLISLTKDGNANFINHCIHGDASVYENNEIDDGLLKYIQKLSATIKKIDKSTTKVAYYRRSEGLFSLKDAVKNKTTMTHNKSKWIFLINLTRLTWAIVLIDILIDYSLQFGGGKLMGIMFLIFQKLQLEYWV